MIATIGRLGPLFVTVSKHEVAGIVGIVVGALIAIFGAVRAAQRLSGAALYILLGVVVVVVSVLVFTHTIRS